MASQRVKHSTSKGIGVFIFIEGIDCKDKFIVRQVAATQRRRHGPAVSSHRASRPARTCLHFITSDND